MNPWELKWNHLCDEQGWNADTRVELLERFVRSSANWEAFVNNVAQPAADTENGG